MDTLGCGFEALEYPACTKLLGPIDPETVTPRGAKVPGTRFQLDPGQAACSLGAMIRWLDFNDTGFAAEWRHPVGQPRRHPRHRPRKASLPAGSSLRGGARSTCHERSFLMSLELYAPPMSPPAC